MAAVAASRASGIGRDQLSEVQRARLLSGMVQVVIERGGLAEATIAQVVARAGVSRRTFYELFSDRGGCFLAALDDAVDRAYASVLPAYRSAPGWLERMRVALAALLAFLDTDRSTGRFLIISCQSTGNEAFERRQKILKALSTAIDQGRQEGKAHDPPSLTAEGVIGGVLAILHARTTVGDTCVMRLHPQLMSMIVMPYLGSAAARRELARRPTLPPNLPPARSDADVLGELGLRLTYRTMRVLMHLAEHPRSSNREIGTATGMSDQGQTSKLLHRLQRLNLIENTGGPPHRGTPNAWQLTTQGHNAQHAINTNTSLRAP